MELVLARNSRVRGTVYSLYLGGTPSAKIEISILPPKLDEQVGAQMIHGYAKDFAGVLKSQAGHR